MLIYLCLLLALVHFRWKSKSVLCQRRLSWLHSGQSNHTVREINVHQKGPGALGRAGLALSRSARTAVAAKDHWHSEATLQAQTAKKTKCAEGDVRFNLHSCSPQWGAVRSWIAECLFARHSGSIQMRVLLCQPGLGTILELFLQSGWNKRLQVKK